MNAGGTGWKHYPLARRGLGATGPGAAEKCLRRKQTTDKAGSSSGKHHGSKEPEVNLRCLFRRPPAPGRFQQPEVRNMGKSWAWLLWLAAACAARQPPELEARLAKVEGQVVEKATKQGIPGARVVLLRWDRSDARWNSDVWNAPLSAPGTAPDSGQIAVAASNHREFSLVITRPAEFLLFVSAPGFVRASRCKSNCTRECFGQSRQTRRGKPRRRDCCRAPTAWRRGGRGSRFSKTRSFQSGSERVCSCGWQQARRRGFRYARTR